MWDFLMQVDLPWLGIWSFSLFQQWVWPTAEGSWPFFTPSLCHHNNINTSVHCEINFGQTERLQVNSDHEATPGIPGQAHPIFSAEAEQIADLMIVSLLSLMIKSCIISLRKLYINNPRSVGVPKHDIHYVSIKDRVATHLICLTI